MYTIMHQSCTQHRNYANQSLLQTHVSMRLGWHKVAEKYVFKQNNPRKAVFLTGKTIKQSRHNIPRQNKSTQGPDRADLWSEQRRDARIGPALLTRLLGSDHPARSEQSRHDGDANRGGGQQERGAEDRRRP